MPITKSAKKRLRQDKKRNKRNKARKKAYKEIEKKIKDLVKDNKKKKAQEMLSDYYKAVDKAAKTNAIKEGKASRKKSRITKLVKKD